MDRDDKENYDNDLYNQKDQYYNSTYYYPNNSNYMMVGGVPNQMMMYPVYQNPYNYPSADPYNLPPGPSPGLNQAPPADYESSLYYSQPPYIQYSNMAYQNPDSNFQNSDIHNFTYPATDMNFKSGPDGSNFSQPSVLPNIPVSTQSQMTYRNGA
jgi:hypothetical protein